MPFDMPTRSDRWDAAVRGAVVERLAQLSGPFQAGRGGAWRGEWGLMGGLTSTGRRPLTNEARQDPPNGAATVPAVAHLGGDPTAVAVAAVRGGHAAVAAVAAATSPSRELPHPSRSSHS